MARKPAKPRYAKCDPPVLSTGCSLLQLVDAMLDMTRTRKAAVGTDIPYHYIVVERLHSTNEKVFITFEDRYTSERQVHEVLVQHVPQLIGPMLWLWLASLASQADTPAMPSERSSTHQLVMLPANVPPHAQVPTCTVCLAAGRELTTQCSGRPLLEIERRLVAKNHLNYRSGKWCDEGANPPLPQLPSGEDR